MSGRLLHTIIILANRFLSLLSSTVLFSSLIFHFFPCILPGGELLLLHGVLEGDLFFNCPLNPLLDKKGGILTPKKSVVKTIESLQDELDLVDIWRIKNPKKKVLLGARTLQ